MEGKIMPCNPKCPYFPKIELDLQYKTDCFGVKRRIKSITKPACMYDLSAIDGWNRKCPRINNMNKLMLNAMRGL